MPVTEPLSVVCCVDVGSTFTKVVAVSLPDGGLLATGSAPTTAGTDVMTGISAAVGSALEQVPLALAGRPFALEPVLACSSAGGGLRLAVVGYERAVTAEAGFRVGLTAGAKVVHVSAGRLDADALEALAAAAPDVLLLVGGTDGGNQDVLLGNARALAAAGPVVPVVVAGNVDVRDEVVAVLSAPGSRAATALPAANVLPRIGVLDPRPARAAIREVFIRHVIGGKQLTRSPEFAAMVRAATPDAVLAGVELLADGVPDEPELPGVGQVVVVDIGGATTDVYSVVIPDPEEAALHREVVEPLWRARTVEGDLGLRWNAPGVVAAAVTEQLVDAEEAAGLGAAAELRAADPGWLPGTDREQADDVRLAALATTVALRRHARPQLSGQVRTSGKDLRQVGLVIGSGGVLRHGAPGTLEAVLGPAMHDLAGGWLVPAHPTLAVDSRYVLAAAGLLAADHPRAAARLAQLAGRPAGAPPAARAGVVGSGP